jgi:4-hydroxy-tetrahydrodipicolinate reductase
MIQLTLCGLAGRMGQQIARAVADEPDMVLVLGLEHPDHPWIGTEVDNIPVAADLEASWRPCHVVIDFTLGSETGELARVAALNGAAFISGATGLGASDYNAMKQAAKSVPVLHSNNLSQGVTVAADLIERAARALPGYDIEIVEFHHNQKKDAPSGTALHLLKRLKRARAGLLPVHGRVGTGQVRDVNEVGIHSLRGGDAVGEHRIIFSGPGERLVVTHLADNRRAFVTGLLGAIRFMIGNPPGLYSMEDILSPPEGELD